MRVYRVYLALGSVLFVLTVLACLALLLSPSPPHSPLLPLAALALSGPCWMAAVPYNSHAVHEGMFHIGIPLALFALLLPRLDRLLGDRDRCSALAGVAAAPRMGHGALDRQGPPVRHHLGGRLLAGSGDGRSPAFPAARVSWPAQLGAGLVSGFRRLRLHHGQAFPDLPLYLRRSGAFEHLENEVDAVLFAAVERAVRREIVDFPSTAGGQVEFSAGDGRIPAAAPLGRHP